jgi:hypothetical protein
MKITPGLKKWKDSSMSARRKPNRIHFITTALLLAALACDFPGDTPTPDKPAPDTATPTKKIVPPTETETLAPPTETETLAPPTATDTLEPPTATSTTSPWVFVSGTWSGCVTSSGPPVTTGACSSALGPFSTLYLKPTCVIGEHCGNFVKGAFESEFILLKLTLTGISGSTIYMHGQASGIFSWATTDIKIERVGANVRVTEVAGSGDVTLLPQGCDPIIQSQTTIGCSQSVP